MNIALDISQIVYSGTGVARFTHGFASSLVSLKTGHSFSFFYYSFRRKPPASVLAEIQSAGHTVKEIPLPPRIMEPVWNKFRLMPITRIIPGLDWVITSDWTEPSASCRKATVVHDLAFKRFPETIDPHILTVMNRKLPLVAAESKIIFADSESTKSDLEEYYHLPSKRIQVVYPGVSVITPNEDVRDRAARTFHIEKPFLLSVGKIEPRKNLARLIEAFSQLKRTDVELLIVGPQGWDTTLSPPPGVRFLGFVPDAELYALYTLSCGFIMPSLWEGFGYPVLEAMLLKAPLATSNRSSLKELGEHHAELFDPENTVEITEALKKLLNKSNPERLTAAQTYAKTFTWKRYAQQVIHSLEQAA
jgi:glycosyltransferase involved in cell wall biosynthesis